MAILDDDDYEEDATLVPGELEDLLREIQATGHKNAQRLETLEKKLDQLIHNMTTRFGLG